MTQVRTFLLCLAIPISSLPPTTVQAQDPAPPPPATWTITITAPFANQNEKYLNTFPCAGGTTGAAGGLTVKVSIVN